MNALNRPDLVTDFGQFAGLRADARAQSPEALRKTAQQFEALMTQQMLKSARAASLGDDVMGGGQMGFYQDMFDQQMAVHMSSGRGLGIADLLVRQLQGRQAAAADAAPDVSRLNPLPQRPPAIDTSSFRRMQDACAEAGVGTASRLCALDESPRSPSGSPAAFNATHLSGVRGNDGASVAGHAATEKSGWRSRSAAEFVAQIRPHAEAAAAELGVPARVLIAQAALETGWGRKAIRSDDGGSSNNLFGIKADRRWSGAKVERMTTEYSNGVAQTESARFRSYASAGESFADYVKFIKSNPRYAEALRHGGSESNYVAGLQKAGYATDPAYAQKILRVAHGPTMTAALAAVQGSAPDTPRQLSV